MLFTQEYFINHSANVFNRDCKTWRTYLECGEAQQGSQKPFKRWEVCKVRNVGQGSMQSLEREIVAIERSVSADPRHGECLPQPQP